MNAASRAKLCQLAFATIGGGGQLRSVQALATSIRFQTTTSRCNTAFIPNLMALIIRWVCYAKCKMFFRCFV
jgi:hypothetical protein